MAEYFIIGNTFAAPFFSDTVERFVEASTPEDALTAFAGAFTHPAGLYAAACYTDATAYHKGAKPLARWLSNHEIEKRRLTEGMGAYSYRGDGPGEFEINGRPHRAKDPKGGRVIKEARNGD